jgi:hypothetical protein
MSFEAANDAGIEWLDTGCKIWLEIHELNICRFVGDVVARKIVKVETNLSVLSLHHAIKHPDPPAVP